MVIARDGDHSRERERGEEGGGEGLIRDEGRECGGADSSLAGSLVGPCRLEPIEQTTNEDTAGLCSTAVCEQSLYLYFHVAC